MKWFLATTLLSFYQIDSDDGTGSISWNSGHLVVDRSRLGNCMWSRIAQISSWRLDEEKN